MSFSQTQVAIWRRAIFVIVILSCILGTVIGLAAWEVLQCGDEYENYCRERNYLDILVVGGLPLISGVIAFFASNYLLREPN